MAGNQYNDPRLTREDHNLEFMKSLKNVWSQCKKCDVVHSMIQSYLSVVENCYSTALHLVRNAPDYNPPKIVSLAYTIMEQFSIWVKNQHHYLIYLTNEVKHEAFVIASKQKHKNLSLAIVETYKLKESNDSFMPILKEMLEDHMYKEVSEWAVFLNLENRFDLYDFVIPLLFQDKNTVVDNFVKTNPKFNLELVKYLDSILTQKNIAEYINQIIAERHISGVNPSILAKLCQPKVLCKLIKRLAAFHHLQADVTPNMSTNTAISTVHFLVRKRYLEFNLGKEAFRELVLDACGSNKLVHIGLVARLADNHDFKEALYWGKFYKIAREDLPLQVRELDDSGYSEELIPVLEEHDKNTAQFHNLNLPESSIIIVDTESKFADMIETGVDGATLVGIDTEWKPTMSSNSKSDLSLIQIATENKVYLLDILPLTPYRNLWHEFFSIFLANPKVTKVGFALGTDLISMSQSLPVGEINLNRTLAFVDLSLLWTRLVRDFKFKFPYCENVNCSSSGLSQLVAICLGKPLNKNEQFSNWQARPLRPSQLIYAALDAYCVLEVFHIIENLCEKRNIPFDQIIHELSTMQFSKTKTKRSKPKPQKINYKVVNENPVDVNWLKAACDDSFFKLGQQLRRWGIDCYIFTAKATIAEMARVCIEENRLLLAPPLLYAKAEKHLQENRRYQIESKHPENQLIEVIKLFNIVVRKENILSRCQLCNSDDIYAYSAKKLIDEDRQNHVNVIPAGEESDASDTEFGYESDDYDSNYAAKPINPLKIIRTPKGAAVRLYKLRENAIDPSSDCFICNDCGEVFWEGGYFDRVLGQISWE